MSKLIGLNSFNMYDSPKYIVVDEDGFSFDTLFRIDRTIRASVSEFPTATWDYLEKGLVTEGFVFVAEVANNENVFWHPRYWNEHLTPTSRSFFVVFPDSAPYELAGEIVLATNYPSLFALVPNEYINGNKMLLLNSNHEPIYPDDLAYGSLDGDVCLPLGPVAVVAEQFATQDDIEVAQQHLVESGFIVSGALA